MACGKEGAALGCQYLHIMLGEEAYYIVALLHDKSVMVCSVDRLESPITVRGYYH